MSDRIRELEAQVSDLIAERNALAAVARAAYREGLEHGRRERVAARRRSHLQAVTITATPR